MTFKIPEFIREDEEFMRACTVAADAHTGQVRKFTGEQYIVHPISVATSVHMAYANAKQLHHRDYRRSVVAALLHDVVEDTDVTLADIAEQFGYQAATDVFWLTAPLRSGSGSRRLRKHIASHFLAQAPTAIRGVKFCDMADNLPSMKDHNPEFAVKYAKEKAVDVALMAADLDPVVDKLVIELADRVRAIIGDILQPTGR